MLRIGLTGGIASGKSTVAAMLRDRNYPVIDADALAREFLDPGQDAYKEVVAHFSNSILAPGGAVDRRKLAAIVFSNPQERDKLNQILHPRIRDVVANWFAALSYPGGPELAFEDAALILESGGRGNLDRIVVCWCRPEQQLARLRERGMAEQDARMRIAAQMPIDEKRKLADEVIDCSGSLEETERQVDQAIARLRQG
jgi:dephospho-CoA kinase